MPSRTTRATWRWHATWRCHVARPRGAGAAISTSCITPCEHSEYSQGLLRVLAGGNSSTHMGVLRVLPSTHWRTQERFRAISTSYIRDVHAVVLIYDVTSDATFKNTRTWMRVRAHQQPGSTTRGGCDDQHATSHASRHIACGTPFRLRCEAVHGPCTDGGAALARASTRPSLTTLNCVPSTGRQWPLRAAAAYPCEYSEYPCEYSEYPVSTQITPQALCAIAPAVAAAGCCVPSALQRQR
jgi:hypothetical protein